MDQAVYLIIGAFLASGVGIFVNRVEHWYKRREEKRDVCRAFEMEIKLNQVRIGGLNQSILSDDLFKLIGLELDQRLKYNESYTKRLLEVYHFERSVFTALSGKIGLLNEKAAISVYGYYVNLSNLEFKWKVSTQMLIFSKDEKEVQIIRNNFAEEANKLTGLGEDLIIILRYERGKHPN
jgi:hypothetical protein